MDIGKLFKVLMDESVKISAAQHLIAKRPHAGFQFSPFIGKSYSWPGPVNKLLKIAIAFIPKTPGPVIRLFGFPINNEDGAAIQAFSG